MVAFSDVLRFADDQAERDNPRPSPQFRRFFAQFVRPHQVTPVVQERLDPSFGTASGARLTMLL
jgi:hypothetical protein